MWGQGHFAIIIKTTDAQIGFDFTPVCCGSRNYQWGTCQ